MLQLVRSLRIILPAIDYTNYTVTTIAGSPGVNGYQNGIGTNALFGGAAEFGYGPAAIAVDSVGNLYVADTKNDRALEYNGPFGFEQTNNVTADLVFSGNNLAQPSGVAADSNGNFYVSSEPHNQVYEYTEPVPLMTADLLNLMIGPGAQNPNAASLQFPMGRRSMRSTICTSPTRRTIGCWSSMRAARRPRK